MAPNGQRTQLTVRPPGCQSDTTRPTHVTRLEVCGSFLGPKALQLGRMCVITCVRLCNSIVSALPPQRRLHHGKGPSSVSRCRVPLLAHPRPASSETPRSPTTISMRIPLIQIWNSCSAQLFVAVRSCSQLFDTPAKFVCLFHKRKPPRGAAYAPRLQDY